MDKKTPIELPKLNPLISLHKAPEDHNGAPVWSLHNAVSNQYFRIDWISFECLARFSIYKNTDELINAVNSETTLHINQSDIENLIAFLNQNGLTELESQSIAVHKNSAQAPFWKKLFRNYLFFSIPLVRPHKFLQKTLPFIRPFLTKPFIIFMLLILASALFATFQRSDEFLTTFTHIFTPEGLILGLITFAILKIIHEFSHAYTAEKYGVSVPHMGVALIIMYPVLYTETSGSWRLSSPQKRLHIGMAGILAELCIAGPALWLWHFSSPGDILHSLSFMIVTVSLIGSLLVNLNPLMRFDGYYMLSDYTGFENLQTRSCAFARYHLRRLLFANTEPAPETLSQAHQKFLTLFGFTLLIYRFFLFLGIAALVYLFFPKPFNIFFAGAEIYWFLFLPILTELKTWYKNLNQYWLTSRTKYTASLALLILFLTLIPWKNTITLPAIIHAQNDRSFYAIEDSYIKELRVQEGDQVQMGEILATLSAPFLEKKLKSAEKTLQNLQQYRRRLATSPAQAKEQINEIDTQINITRQALENLQKREETLTIKAPFEGEIRDLSPELHENRFIPRNTMLFHLITPGQSTITAYIEERALKRIKKGTKAYFIPLSEPFNTHKTKIAQIDAFTTKNLNYPSLSSLYGGPIPASFQDMDHTITPVQSLFKIEMATLKKKQNIDFKIKNEEIGFVHIKGKTSSLAWQIFEKLAANFRHENLLN